ncbi:MAG: EAL domain-containing protein [Mitsuokella jalaludinii]|nr:EAL domain-containing protein [Mitsuokella jalaludinii]MCI6606187.1 EAL domain-containing protein [Mitsuokella jalaludinii]MDD7745340.1 EAL domain-containing protein [Mitsuokella jalaludinii]
MSDKIRDRAVLSRFSDALGRGEVQLYLQAQVGAGDRHVIGAEALSRWVCEDGRVIPPAVFIPILEEHGKIWQLDYHIWEMACRLLKSWKDDPVFGSYRISVNISVKDIYYLDLYEVFTHLVEEYKIDPEHLELEITETVFMDKPKEAIALIQRLKEYGFTIAIDDFGSGYSSLSFLKDIQADILKIGHGVLAQDGASGAQPHHPALDRGARARARHADGRRGGRDEPAGPRSHADRLRHLPGVLLLTARPGRGL